MTSCEVPHCGKMATWLIEHILAELTYLVCSDHGPYHELTALIEATRPDREDPR